MTTARRDELARRERWMQFRRRPELALLAYFALASAARAQVEALPQPAPLAAPAPSSGATKDGAAAVAPSWGAAPVAWSGVVSYDLRSDRAQGEGRTLSQLVSGELRANSYIYQPWLATVGGTVRLTTDWSRVDRDASDQGPFASQDRISSKEQFVTGTARADVFPLSRFPFEVHTERDDSRFDTGLASPLDFRTQIFGASQRYQPASGLYTLNTSVERREQSAAFTRDRQDRFNGDIATRWKYNELSLGLSLSEAQQLMSSDRSDFRSLVARHNYRLAGPLSVDTTVNWTQTQEQLTGQPTDINALQWSSVGVWHREGSELVLTGGVRGMELRDEVAHTANDSLGLMLGATYDLNKNARVTANATAVATDANGTTSDGLGGSVGASWQGDTLEYKGVRYDWFTSASATGSSSTRSTSASASGSSTTGSSTTGSTDGSDTQTSVGAQIGHNLSRPWKLAPQSLLVLNFAQTLSATQNRASNEAITATNSSTLLQTLSGTWNTSGGNRNGYARVSYSDSTEIGGGNARLQLFNFQLSGNFNLERNRSLTGDLTVQQVTQKSGESRLPASGEVVGGQSTASGGASGEINFTQQRLLGFPRLRFTSRLKLAQDVLRQPGTLPTIPDRETRLWENRLDWLIGRLETQLLVRVSQIDGRRRDFLMWRVQRNFGN